MCDECTEQAWEMSAEDERERIIKLLEDKAFWLVHLDKFDEVELLRNLVALIKGEQK